jgi:hypothetical protein
VIVWSGLDVRVLVSAKDIAAVVAKIKKMPAAGDKQHVPAVFPVYAKPMPSVANWSQAKQKVVKFKKLQAHNGELDRDNLIWHVQNPGKSKMQSPHNTHPQVIKTVQGDYVIADGDHRLAALRLLGVKKDMVWLLDAKDTN